MPTTQELFQTIAGVTAGSPQQVVNEALGFSTNQYSLQAALNIPAGRQPHALSTQDALRANIGSWVSLTAGKLYSIQELLQIAVTNNLTMTQVAGFNPTSGSIGWYASYYAEGTQNTPFVADSAVAQWDDNSGNSRHATQGSGALQPTYRSSVAELNSKPAIEFNADCLVSLSATFGTLTTPYSIVVIGKWGEANTSTRNLLAAGDTTISYFRRTGNPNVLNHFNGIAGLSLTGVTLDTNAHLFAAVNNSTNSRVLLDTNSATGNVGGQPLVGITIYGTNATASSESFTMGFLGLYKGNITSLDQWPVFKKWAARYGITA